MKWGLLTGLMVIISAVAFVGCVDSGKALQEKFKARHKIVAYGVMDPQISAQQIIAEEKGYFREEGLEVENRLVQSGGEIPALIRSGEAQVSFESPYTVMTLVAEGVKVKVVAPMADIGDTQCVVARKDSGIVNGKDFEGKRIGMAEGSGILLALRNMCYELKVDMDRITFVPLSPRDQLQAMEAGTIDAMACWEPWVSNAQAMGGTLLFSGLQSYLGDRQGEVDWLSFYTTMQITDDYLHEHTEDVKAMLRALEKATIFINENPEEAAAIIAGKLNLEKDQVSHIMEKNYYSMSIDQHFRSTCEEVSSFMMKMGQLQDVPIFWDYVNLDYLRATNRSLVTIK
ncbi:ABC transporter substrate-binding protein [Selenomonas sp. KH1T6]|uniref:ABC transporter substrate-binding protein n=1 Tax=Selenomonas sp. KH1T6 TaxID=3158784 RepID=UPI0008A79EE2|nr:NitT/TauT family transport system substrate-binding protein [Selenomonas ruminantium]